MSVSPGTRLGPYEIIARIGAGGMGEVFEARDTRLDRRVAIKVLPAELAQNAQFRLRFEREAKTISQLSHPNICALFDVGENYLVMELLDGQTLADRLDNGPLPLTEVLRFGVQIAEALDKAHRAGIVHRDLKPSNIMITKSGAKLLDFGLAKSAAAVFDADGATQHKPLTQEGTILGTFQYMAPEQLEGAEADTRTDIFAFGTLLYEMATGTRAFAGKTRTSLIAAIVSGEPKPLSQLQPLTPPSLEHVIAKCLEKDPDARWQSAYDVAEELRWSGTHAAATSGSRRTRGVWPAASVAALLALAAGIAGGRLLFRAKPRVVRFTIPTTEGPYHGAWLAAPSPDGKRLVFGASNREGVSQLFVRSIDRLEAEPIRGTDREIREAPLFGTDPKSVLYFAEGRLKKLDLDTSTIETICECGNDAFGASINGEGTVLYSRPDGITMRSRDGAIRTITHLDRDGREISHRWPTFLPDGKHFLYVARAAPESPRPGVLYLASIDSPKRIAVTDSLLRGVYADGYLFLPRDKKLMAFPFDVSRGAISGGGVVMAERVNTFADRGWSAFNVTESGVLTWRIRTDQNKLVWVDASGRVTSSVGSVGDFGAPRISPDGKRVAVSVIDPERETYDMWVYGLDKPTTEHITSDPGNESSPVWSPDGKRLAYCADDGTSAGHGSIRLHAFQSAAPDEVIFRGQGLRLDAWSPDGKRIFYDAFSPATKQDAWSVEVEGAHAQTAVTQTPFMEGGAVPSPDGRWLAFDSQQSGKWQLYVRPLGGGGETVQVSISGTETPGRWSADGKRIYFVNNRAMMFADVRTGGGLLAASEPRQLFEFSFAARDFDVAADGRFLVVAPLEQREEEPTGVIVNWQEVIKQKQQ
ncbi:MAG: protein kinase [Acidobacteriota bacterium]|nr:protein kinase [Acidobacteriota bacterium]